MKLSWPFDNPTHGRREQGFTLVEVLVGLLVSTIVLSLVYASYTFSARLVTRWQSALTLENTAHVITRDLTRHGWQASTVRCESAKRCTFAGVEEESVTYALSEGTLLRNGTPMHSGKTSIPQFEVKVYRRDSDPSQEPGETDGRSSAGPRPTDPSFSGALGETSAQPRGRDDPASDDPASDDPASGDPASGDGFSSDASARPMPLVHVKLSVAVPHDTLRISTAITLRHRQGWERRTSPERPPRDASSLRVRP